MTLPRYPKYRDSGVQWIGELPEHWELRRLKRICRVFPSNVDKKTGEGETPVLLCNYTDVYYNDRIVAGMDFMPATATEDQIAKFTLRGGDTVITKDSETADDIAVATYVPSDLPAVVCGYHLSIVRPRHGINGAFVKRLFDSIYAKASFAVRATGMTRVGLSQYHIDNVDMPVPPPAEQAAIADFLDREAVKIDALIGEQQRLIDLLQEKREAVISRAVTQGLDPDAAMRDSGMAWLGQVPEHWDVRPNKAVMTLRKREVGSAWSQTPLLSLTLRGIVLRDIKSGDGKYPSDFSTYQLVERGDLVFCLFDMDETPRTVGVSNHDGMITGAYDVFTCKGDAWPSYVYYFYLHVDQQKHLRPFYTGLRKTVRTPTFLSIKMPFPPLAEQRAIADFLDLEAARSDTLIAEARRSIALLRERRTALISAAVTGQIDVRGLAPAEAA